MLAAGNLNDSILNGIGIPQTLKDPGSHYRRSFRVKLSDEDIKNGYVDVQLDPYRIALVYRMIDHMEFFILKKILRLGAAHKEKRQELLDIKNAADRRIEILDEDN